MSTISQDRKKIVFSILLLILLGLYVHRFWSGGTTGKAGGQSLAQKINALSPDQLKLRLDLLESGGKATKASSRNIFGAGDGGIKEKAPVKPPEPTVLPPVKPPEPELPHLEYMGFVDYAAEKVAVFRKGEGVSQELFLLKINDRTEDKFELREIGEDGVIFQNLSNGKEARLNVTEMPSSSGSVQRLPISGVRRRLPPITSGLPGLPPPVGE